jgi:hypothetical protein
MKIRAKSLEVWKKNPNAEAFDKAMEKPLYWLRFYTKMYHRRRRLTHLKNRLIEEISERLFSKKKS